MATLPDPHLGLTGCLTSHRAVPMLVYQGRTQIMTCSWQSLHAGPCVRREKKDLTAQVLLFRAIGISAEVAISFETRSADSPRLVRCDHRLPCPSRELKRLKVKCGAFSRTSRPGSGRGYAFSRAPLLRFGTRGANSSFFLKLRRAFVIQAGA